jgi:hypothetical protein
MTLKERRLTSYTISKVRRAAAHEYYVTISKDGESVGDVVVLSNSSANGYYNDNESDKVVAPKRRASK